MGKQPPARHDGGFVVEQATLEGEAAGVADELARGADHAVTGDDDGERVLAIGGTNGAGGGRLADGGGKLGVAEGLAEGDSAQGGPDALLEGCADCRQREIEGEPFAGRVFGELRERGLDGRSRGFEPIEPERLVGDTNPREPMGVVEQDRESA